MYARLHSYATDKWMVAYQWHDLSVTVREMLLLQCVRQRGFLWQNKLLRQLQLSAPKYRWNSFINLDAMCGGCGAYDGTTLAELSERVPWHSCRLLGLSKLPYLCLSPTWPATLVSLEIVSVVSGCARIPDMVNLGLHTCTFQYRTLKIAPVAYYISSGESDWCGCQTPCAVKNQWSKWSMDRSHGCLGT